MLESAAAAAKQVPQSTWPWEELSKQQTAKQVLESLWPWPEVGKQQAAQQAPESSPLCKVAEWQAPSHTSAQQARAATLSVLAAANQLPSSCAALAPKSV